jgi:membrane protein
MSPDTAHAAHTPTPPHATAPDSLHAVKPPPSYPQALWQVMLSAGQAWLRHRAASKGAALALYTLFSLAPILILVVALASLFFDQNDVRQLLQEQIGGLIGTQGGDAIKAILANASLSGNSVTASIISGVVVLVSATSAFAELKDSLDELWEIPAREGSGIWAMLRERFLSFGLLLVLALMLLASLAVSTALAALGDLWTGADDTVKILTLVVSNGLAFVIVSVLFAAIYKYLPGTPIAWRDVIVGALLTAVLFMLGKVGIGFYLGHGGFSNAYGAAGSIVALITWIYYSAQIFFYGALFTHEYALKLGSHKHQRHQ